jgi:hypothetical protein
MKAKAKAKKPVRGVRASEGAHTEASRRLNSLKEFGIKRLSILNDTYGNRDRVFVSASALALQPRAAKHGCAVFRLDSLERIEGLAEKALDLAQLNRSANPCCVCWVGWLLRGLW